MYPERSVEMDRCWGGDVDLKVAEVFLTAAFHQGLVCMRQLAQLFQKLSGNFKAPQDFLHIQSNLNLLCDIRFGIQGAQELYLQN